MMFRKLRRSRIEYLLFRLAHEGDPRAERAWYELVKPNGAATHGGVPSEKAIEEWSYYALLRDGNESW